MFCQTADTGENVTSSAQIIMSLFGSIICSNILSAPMENKDCGVSLLV